MQTQLCTCSLNMPLLLAHDTITKLNTQKSLKHKHPKVQHHWHQTPPLLGNTHLPQFKFPITLLSVSSNRLGHARSFYAVFSPISCIRWPESQGQAIYLGRPRLTHPKVPTTAVSPLSPFNRSQRNILSPKRYRSFGLRRWTMSKMSVTAGCPNYCQDNTKSTTLKHVEEVLLMITVKSKTDIKGLKWNNNTHFLKLFYCV